MDQNAFELTVNYIIEKEAEHGIGKDGKTGFLQVDHHGSRDSADAQRKLYDNNWNVAGPVSHGSHWGAALDCGYNAFADREMCKRLSAWYAAAKRRRARSVEGGHAGLARVHVGLALALGRAHEHERDATHELRGDLFVP